MVTVIVPFPPAAVKFWEDGLMLNEQPARLNVAVTVRSELIVTTQVPIPEHPPPTQPANTEPPDGVAVKVATVPCA